MSGPLAGMLGSTTGHSTLHSAYGFAVGSKRSKWKYTGSSKNSLFLLQSLQCPVGIPCNTVFATAEKMLRGSI